jgi:hypothetical protein
LGQNQTQVKGQLKPAAGKNKIGQASGALMGQVVLHDQRDGVGFFDAIVLHFERSSRALWWAGVDQLWLMACIFKNALGILRCYLIKMTLNLFSCLARKMCAPKAQSLKNFLRKFKSWPA